MKEKDQLFGCMDCESYSKCSYKNNPIKGGWFGSSDREIFFSCEDLSRFYEKMLEIRQKKSKGVKDEGRP